MIPIRDNIRSRSFPIVNWLLVIANILVFLLEISLSPAGLERFIQTYALTPSLLTANLPFSLTTLFTHMFLHSGWFHIISNLWVLIIFGDNVEDRMGSGRYLIFYIFGGLAAGLLQTFMTPGSSIPSLGASGAIAAVLGAYLLFYPGARVITFVPIFILGWFVNIPAVIYLGFWFVLQLFSGLTALVTPSGLSMGGIAWFAHIGGFVFGLLFGRLFARRNPQRWYPDEYRPW